MALASRGMIPILKTCFPIAPGIKIDKFNKSKWLGFDRSLCQRMFFFFLNTSIIVIYFAKQHCLHNLRFLLFCFSKVSFTDHETNVFGSRSALQAKSIFGLPIVTFIGLGFTGSDPGLLHMTQRMGITNSVTQDGFIHLLFEFLGVRQIR